MCHTVNFRASYIGYAVFLLNVFFISLYTESDSNEIEPPGVMVEQTQIQRGPLMVKRKMFVV